MAHIKVTRINKNILKHFGLKWKWLLNPRQHHVHPLWCYKGPIFQKLKKAVLKKNKRFETPLDKVFIKTSNCSIIVKMW